MKSVIRNVAIFLAVFVVAAAVACAGRVEEKDVPTPQPPEPTPVPRALVFPEDDGPHKAPIEWWYYNGHLASRDGEEYSFHFVIFQTQGDGSAETFEIGQVGITDVGREVHHNISSDGFTSQRPSVRSSAEGLLSLDLGNFELDIEPDGSHQLQVEDAASRTSLKLRTAPSESVMLHEGIGWMDWPFGWTYYYSYPRMAAEGTLTLDDRKVDVIGEVWFDHQWGDFFVVGKPAGWQWFAIHLDDGRSLMIAEVRGAEGEVLAIDGTLIQSGSEQSVLDIEQDGIELEVQDYWTSTQTAGEYPAKWRLRVDSIDLDVVMTPSIADQEVPALPYGNQAAAYWEGRVEVSDTASGESLGLAFAELSGYVEPEPLSWRNAKR